MICSESAHNCEKAVSSGVDYTYPSEGRRGGRGVDKGILNLSDMGTIDIMMLGVASINAAKEAWKSWFLMVPVGGSPRVDPCFDDLHSIMLP